MLISVLIYNILPESMSRSLCFCKRTRRQHRDCDMDSGSMSTLLTLSCLHASLKFVGFFNYSIQLHDFLLVAIYPSFTLYKIKQYVCLRIRRQVRESMNLSKGSSNNHSDYIARYCCGSGSTNQISINYTLKIENSPAMKLFELKPSLLQ